MKLNADQLRKGKGLREKGKVLKKLKRNEIYIIIDNVLDTYNIGSIFRLADAVAAKKVILCGGTETPPNHRIKKASINTTEVVDWIYAETTVEAINDLRSTIKNIQIVAIEQAPNSVPYNKFDYKLPVALVVGHESKGIPQKTLDLCDATVELSMFGVNISLNVMVSLAVVLYKVIEKNQYLAE